jgi:ascorbate PTS system EIIA or EIIAB component
MEPLLILPDSGIIIGAPASDWRDAIRWAGRALVASGVATDSYTDEMIATVESLGPYIVIAPGIALAHSRPSPSVLRSGLCLVRLANSVEFGNADNDPVTLVVGLAATDANGHIESLATLADFLADDARREALMAAHDVATVRRLVDDYARTRAADGAAG